MLTGGPRQGYLSKRARGRSGPTGEATDAFMPLTPRVENVVLGAPCGVFFAPASSPNRQSATTPLVLRRCDEICRCASLYFAGAVSLFHL